MRVAFVGLGTMGAPMALRLVAAGHKLTVFNRTYERVRALEAAGADVARTPSQAAATAEAICTCVTDATALRAVALGPDGILQVSDTGGNSGSGKLWIDFSTIGPSAVIDLAASAAPLGIHMVDAPVTGGDRGAKDGTLTVLVGGEKADVAAASPLLHAVGRRIAHMGPLGSGQVTKLVQNLIGGINLVAAAEGLSLARRLGLDPKALAHLLTETTADSFQLRVLSGRIDDDDRRPGFSVANREKDFRLALDMARDVDFAAFASATASQIMTRALQAGLGDQDQTSVWDVVDRE